MLLRLDAVHEPEARIVGCRRCTLVRLHPLPTPAAAEAHYDDAYFRDPVHGYDDYARDDAVFRAIFRRRLEVVRRAGGHGRLLDVGCANGGLLLEASRLGFQASGIEPAPGMAAVAMQRTGCPVRVGTLRGALLAPVSYDVVTAFDVLEHMPDIGEALRHLRRATLPEGLLAVTVPDFGGWWARGSGARWPLLAPWEHVVHFTRRSLTAALRAAGFAHVRFHAAQTPLSLGTVAAKTPIPASWVPRAWAGRGLGLPFGTLFAVAR